MTRKILWLSLMFGSLLPMRQGRADIMISIDMDAATPGIQSNLETTPGTTVAAGLWMELTGSTSIATYNFSVQYDRTELTFQSRSETPNALTGLVELDASNPNETATGLLLRFDGATFGLGPTGPFGPVKIGEVVFTATTPSGNPGEIDVTAGRFEPLFDQFFDNGFAEVTNLVSFVGGSVSVAAVPEPTSLSLIGISLLTGTVFRRKRSTFR